MSFLRDLHSRELDPSKLGVDGDLLDLLYEIGIFGLVRSYFVQAEAIFKGYQAVMPESEVPLLGLGLLGISRANYAEAIRVFEEELLKKNPKSPLGKAYLGLSYEQFNQPEKAQKVLQEVIEEQGDPAAVELAKGVLDRMKEKG